MDHAADECGDVHSTDAAITAYMSVHDTLDIVPGSAGSGYEQRPPQRKVEPREAVAGKAGENQHARGLAERDDCAVEEPAAGQVHLVQHPPALLPGGRISPALSHLLPMPFSPFHTLLVVQAALPGATLTTVTTVPAI